MTFPAFDPSCADLETRVGSSESQLINTNSRIDRLESGTAGDDWTRSLSTRVLVFSCNPVIHGNFTHMTGCLYVSSVKKVAFYTALQNSGNFGPFNGVAVLRFTKVFTNVGNAYNPATGKLLQVTTEKKNKKQNTNNPVTFCFPPSGYFTAPYKGVYYFQFTGYRYLSGFMAIEVAKNGHKIMINAEVTHQTNFEFMTNSLVLELEAGDVIHLRLPTGYQLYDNTGNYTTFSGYLLFLL